MLAEGLTRSLIETLDRPDLRSIAGPLDITLHAAVPMAFLVDGARITLGLPALNHPTIAPTLLRQAIELARLRLDAPDIPAPRACFAAARLAALFHRLDPTCDGRPAPLPPALQWLTDLAEANTPTPALLAGIWPRLAPLLTDNPATIDATALAEELAPAWPHLGPTESLMADGGDARLKVDPRTGLNRYGCSHRPRPWAITFASSTASSLSERGFDGAETARRRTAIALLRGLAPAAAHRDAVLEARAAIARAYGLAGAHQVVLAASGTDCELAALALAVTRSPTMPVTTLLIAPDETGSGVPLAAAGRHFADEAASGAAVSRGELIDGFPETTDLIGIPLRAPDGTPRPITDVDDDCARLVRQAQAKGHRVILHQLDLSKTGLVAPSPGLIEILRQEAPETLLDIVVDACQARLEPARIGGMVAQGMMVMITGSKFFTGPPFCGALLIPEETVRHIATTPLPAGLADYTHAAEWPPVAADTPLPEGANFSLALRWHAALAEMTALAALSPGRIRATLQYFLEVGTQAIEAHPDLTLLDTPPLQRTPLNGRAGWDEVPTILSFLVRDPNRPDQPLALDDARRLHRWLNADLSPWIAETPATRLCHLGQPVPVPQREGAALAGALRLCAGARLVSGEPSHAGMDPMARIERECDDARLALEKIGLILRHWSRLTTADPIPRYKPERATP